jgi:hypothetical protein
MLPNFLIIGAPRSGTTTLYESLKQHPQIFLSPMKEPMFFILEDETKTYIGPSHPHGSLDIHGYRSLFHGVRNQKAIGEASPCYLFSPKAPGKIKKYIPDAKILVILRNPVERAYSHFLFNRLGGIEPLADFSEAMAAEEDRLRKGWFIYWCYQGMGYYGRQIERYFSSFDPQQFRFFLFEDLLDAPAELFRGIFKFLGVDESVRIAKPEKYNSSGTPRSRIVHDLLNRPSLLKSPLKKVLSTKNQYRLLTKFVNRNLQKPPLDEEVRRRLTALYREDLLKTQDLIHRDLSSWLEPRAMRDG